MNLTWNANLDHAKQHIKMFGRNLIKTQARIALLLALQFQGKCHAYLTGPTDVATTKKQKDAWEKKQEYAWEKSYQPSTK